MGGEIHGGAVAHELAHAVEGLAGCGKVVEHHRQLVLIEGFVNVCDVAVDEIEESKAELLILLGDIPIQQFLNKVASVKYNSLQEFQDIYGYGNPTEANIGCTKLKVLPLAHPRQIGGLGFHSKWWKKVHQGWEDRLK